MKARIKATGEIVEVTRIVDRYVMTHHPHAITFEKDELDFDIEDDPDYWERLKHQYAGMAMQALIVEYRNAQSRHGFSESIIQETCAKECIQFAHALVQKLKEKEERK